MLTTGDSGRQECDWKEWAKNRARRRKNISQRGQKKRRVGSTQEIQLVDRRSNEEMFREKLILCTFIVDMSLESFDNHFAQSSPWDRNADRGLGGGGYKSMSRNNVPTEVSSTLGRERAAVVRAVGRRNVRVAITHMRRERPKVLFASRSTPSAE